MLLKDVQVYATRFDAYQAGTKITSIDSFTLAVSRHQTLGDLLAQQSSVFIKTYGPANISTAAFRGSNAEHTAVLWNGFNVQNTMLGLADLSLLPVDFADQVLIEHGGNGVLFGSGAIGGAIRLQSLAKYDSRASTSLTASLGSFGFQRLGVNTSVGFKNWFVRLRAYGQYTSNNFLFKNTSLAGTPEQTRTHAAAESRGIQLDNHFRINAQQELNFFVWYQLANRQIPAVLSQPFSRATQLDEAIRISSEWKVISGNWQTNLRVAGFYEILNFADPATAIDANSRIRTHMGEFEWHYRPHPFHQLLLAFSNTTSAGRHESFHGEKMLNRFAMFATWNFDNRKHFNSNVGIRQEWQDQGRAPLVPFAGFIYHVLPALNLRCNVAASYRFPTLNERFFLPGGNPELKSEQGFSQELGAEYNPIINGYELKFGITVYSRTVDNWIVWVPVGSFAAPRNLRTVWSRGAEGEAAIAKKVGKHLLKWRSALNLTATTNQSSVLANDASVGKQLLYIPFLTHQHHFAWTCGPVFMQYNHQYNGMRYTATDNSNWLNDFYLADLVAGYTLTIKGKPYTLQCHVNNLTNNSYVVLPERPMPGRNFLFTLHINI